MWHVLSAAGFAVLLPNPRGSSGRGRDFGTSLQGAWGTRDVDDVMALVDEAVRQGLVDGSRLGIGGWSYGGYLTNRIVTRTDRFEAAVSGASLANMLADYGVSDTPGWLERELGLPWTTAGKYIAASPLFQADRVRTPTLVLCGQDDYADAARPVGAVVPGAEAGRRGGAARDLPGRGALAERRGLGRPRGADGRLVHAVAAAGALAGALVGDSRREAAMSAVEAGPAPGRHPNGRQAVFEGDRRPELGCPGGERVSGRKEDPAVLGAVDHNVGGCIDLPTICILGEVRPRSDSQALATIRSLGVARPVDLERRGVPRARLYELARAGIVERQGRGLYVARGHRYTAEHAFARVARRVPGGVVCLLSALRFHGLTTQQPAEVWLALPEKARRPRLDYPRLRVARFSGAALAEGIESHTIEGVGVRVYSAAKTVADCFKYRNKIGIDVAVEALKDFARTRRGGANDLARFARVCRVSRVMQPYLDAIA
jgi:hypothetical protein